MGRKVVEFGVKTAILIAILFCGIYHQEIKQSIGAPLTGKARIEEIFGHISMGSEVSGYKVVKNYGYACAWFYYSGHNDGYLNGFNNSERTLKGGLKQGEANALINMRIFSSTFEEQGSKWSSALVNICADKVRLEPL